MREKKEKQDSMGWILVIILLAVFFSIFTTKEIVNLRKKSEDRCLNALRYQEEFNVPIPDRINEFCFLNGYYK